MIWNGCPTVKSRWTAAGCSWYSRWWTWGERETFTRRDYLDKAGELNISENTALQWIKRGMKKGQILKIDRGVYQFQASRACV